MVSNDDDNTHIFIDGRRSLEPRTIYFITRIHNKLKPKHTIMFSKNLNTF